MTEYIKKSDLEKWIELNKYKHRGCINSVISVNQLEEWLDAYSPTTPTVWLLTFETRIQIDNNEYEWQETYETIEGLDVKERLSYLKRWNTDNRNIQLYAAHALPLEDDKHAE